MSLRSWRKPTGSFAVRNLAARLPLVQSHEILRRIGSSYGHKKTAGLGGFLAYLSSAAGHLSRREGPVLLQRSPPSAHNVALSRPQVKPSQACRRPPHRDRAIAALRPPSRHP